MKRGRFPRILLLGALLGIVAHSAGISYAAILADKVVVIKKEKRLVLLRKGEVLKSYAISIGRIPGQKIRRGDNRTPEGKYVIDWRNPNSRYYKALHISYPNNGDIRHSRAKGAAAGGEIMIHGLPEGFVDLGMDQSARNWTKGCVAVSNEEMDEIWELVVDGTPVEIKP